MEIDRIKILNELEALLDRHTTVSSLDHLRRALITRSSDQVLRPNMAIGFDANVLLNLGKGRSVDVVDYLGQQHTGPIVLPTQTLQEFWNNHVGGIHALGGQIKESFDGLSKLINTLDPGYRDFTAGASQLLDDFEDRYGHVLEEEIAGQIHTLLEGLAERALVPQVPRLRFEHIGLNRLASKTPPGFKDQKLGDFYVWTEYLYGLSEARQRGFGFDHAVLITDERKSDWRTNGTVHPALTAEVETLVGCSFETWTLPVLQRCVAGAFSSPGPIPPSTGEADAEQSLVAGSDMPGSADEPDTDGDLPPLPAQS